MIAQLIVICIVPVFNEKDYIDLVAVQGVVLNKGMESLRVDFTRNLAEGGYSMILNSGIKTIASSNCEYQTKEHMK